MSVHFKLDFGMQAYYLAVPFPVERAAVRKIGANKKNGGVKISELANYAVKGLVYESNGILNELADCAARACLMLQESNVPFNVLIADCGRRIFLFPQVPGCYSTLNALLSFSITLKFSVVFFGNVSVLCRETSFRPGGWRYLGHSSESCSLGNQWAHCPETT